MPNVVRANFKSGCVIAPTKIDEVVKSSVIEENRIFNVMLYGIEQSSGDGSGDEDKHQIARN